MATRQEAIWAGEFGNAYVERNQRPEQLAVKTALFSRILQGTSGVSSILELGANVGLNVRALQSLLPSASLGALELNAKAFAQLSAIDGIEAWQGSIFDFKAPRPYDLSFTAGVLIHLNPDRITDAYRTLYESSSRYVLISEYFNPTPVEVHYRGQTEALFKRDWAGEMMDMYPNLKLIDYGFQYRRDPVFPMDNLTWFLMEKR